VDLNKLKVSQGRFISDLDGRSYYCVLGSTRAKKLADLGLRDPVGQKLKAFGYIFTIVGVLAKVPSGGGLRPFGINQAIFIPLMNAERLFKPLGIPYIVAQMSAEAHHTVAQKEITAYFKRIEGPPIGVRSAEQLIKQMEKQMQLFTLLLGAIGSISLIVGGVGVMNVMLVSVAERKKEIGIRRALGAKRRDIQGQFLIESLILSFIGGLLGIAIGVSASYVIAHFSKWQFFVCYPAIFIGFGVSSLVGVFFGFYPARQASLMDPITALRSD
jgi:putative ABC transport system permease protein